VGRRAGTRKVKPIWILLKQETVSGSGISWAHMQVCTSLQTDKHASTPPLSFFTGRMPFLPPNQQRQSTEGSVIGTVHIICRGVSQHKCKSAAVGFAHVGAAGRNYRSIAATAVGKCGHWHIVSVLVMQLFAAGNIH